MAVSGASIVDAKIFTMSDGMALDTFWIQDENGQAIDASGELPGGRNFSNPKELKAIIAQHNAKFSRNLVERLLAYALCRRLEGYDEIVIDGLMQKIAKDDYRMQTLITEVVTSYPFMHRRIE